MDDLLEAVGDATAMLFVGFFWLAFALVGWVLFGWLFSVAPGWTSAVFAVWVLLAIYFYFKPKAFPW